MTVDIKKEEFDFNQVQEKRKKMYFREDGFIVLNEVINDIGSAYLPMKYHSLFNQVIQTYHNESKNYLSFALHPILLWNEKEKGIFIKVLNPTVSKKELTKDFQIFDAKLLELISEKDKHLDKETFLNNAGFNSVIILNDWMYFWRPDLGNNGYLIAVDNDLSDIRFEDIKFEKIQHIKSTENIWTAENYDFEKEFPDDTYRI